MAMQVYTESKGKAPFILNLGTRSMSVANFTPVVALHTRKKKPPSGGSKLYWTLRTDKLFRPTRIRTPEAVTIPTELSEVYLPEIGEGNYKM
jgi:hypothetical protein